MSGLRALIARHRVDAALVLLALALLAPVVSNNSAQPASRIALTAALAEHGSVDIQHYPLGIDYSVYHGLRSDKAPGQPVMVVPAYLAARVVGAESAAHRRVSGNLTLWWTTLWSAMLPFAALLIVMRRTAARVNVAAALPATLAVGFGTLLMPFGAGLYGHVLASLLGLGAWSLLSADSVDERATFFAGLLAGAAVFVEYETAIIAIVLLVYVAVVARPHLRWFVTGGVPGALALAAYEWIAFGAPWHFPYSTYIGKLNGSVVVR
jgi:hypothetical protein